ncbi:MAG TPA: hypothetical protein VFA76_06240 [Terriglobales bacterium]|nr:hypothetical protein [Terriglobales bacterium]
MKRIMAVVMLVAATLYIGDYLIVRSRIAMNRRAFGSVSVEPYYAIHQKNGKTEYVFKEPEKQICVRSLFPHFGYGPCWYIARHSEKRTDI